jgi:hypothetical protein
MPEKRTCMRWLLTESTPGIVFDTAGVCNNYTTYETKLDVLGEKKAAELLDYHKKKNKNKKYDCLISLSGGKDSTYTLYKLVKDYGMRVLCIHYNNPFISPQARENPRRASEILGVKIVKWSFPENAHLEATKNALRIWIKRSSASVIENVLCQIYMTPGDFPFEI